MVQNQPIPFTVLYVEDDEILREEVSTFLKRRFKHVITANNGKEGFDKFSVYPVDFVITDLKMPVMDGLEMAALIRTANSTVPIIIITAMSDIELMQSSIETGVDGYLIKPVNFDDLTKTLEKINEKLKGNMKVTIMPSLSKSLERNVESDVAKLLKQKSGKGPEKVQAFVHANIAEIVVIGSRTPFENTLLTSESNLRIGDYVRDIFYKQIREDFERIIFLNCGFRAILQSINSNSQKDVDIIKFIVEY